MFIRTSASACDQWFLFIWVVAYDCCRWRTCSTIISFDFTAPVSIHHTVVYSRSTVPRDPSRSANIACKFILYNSIYTIITSLSNRKSVIFKLRHTLSNRKLFFFFFFYLNWMCFGCRFSTKNDSCMSTNWILCDDIKCFSIEFVNFYEYQHMNLSRIFSFHWNFRFRKFVKKNCIYDNIRSMLRRNFVIL